MGLEELGRVGSLVGLMRWTRRKRSLNQSRGQGVDRGGRGVVGRQPALGGHADGLEGVGAGAGVDADAE